MVDTEVLKTSGFGCGGSSPPAPICSSEQHAELVKLVVTIASKAIAARRVGSSPTFGILTFGLTAVQDVRETALDD